MKTNVMGKTLTLSQAIAARSLEEGRSPPAVSGLLAVHINTKTKTSTYLKKNKETHSTTGAV